MGMFCGFARIELLAELPSLEEPEPLGSKGQSKNERDKCEC